MLSVVCRRAASTTTASSTTATATMPIYDQLSKDSRKAIDRIIRVDHAGRFFFLLLLLLLQCQVDTISLLASELTIVVCALSWRQCR